MPAFVYEELAETLNERAEVPSVERLVDHIRYKIAARAGDIAIINELRRLRGEVHPQPYTEGAPALVALYHDMIRWIQAAKIGEWYEGRFGNTYRIYCVRSERPDRPQPADEKAP